MKKTTLLLILCLLTATFTEAADKLSLRDVVNGTYRSQRILGVNPLLDGEHYAQISPDGKRIVKYSFKTGKEAGYFRYRNGSQPQASIH